MDLIDIIFLIPLVFAGFRGFTKGFIIEITSLLALILGIYGAVNFSDYLSAFLDANWEISESYLPYVAFTVTLILIVILVYMTGKFLEGVVNIMAMGFFNKLLGLFFGLIKSLLFMSCFVYILQQVDVSNKLISEERKLASMFYNPLFISAEKVISSFGDGDWKPNLEGLEDFEDFGEQDFYFKKNNSED